MASTAILPSRDCLRQFNRPHDPNPNLYGLRRRKRSPVGFDSGRNRGRGYDPAVVDNTRLHARSLIMGQVKILKRGEPLDGTSKKTTTPWMGLEGDDLVLCSTERLGPDPATVQKQVKVSIMDSTAFGSSPPPSSLPLPAFFKKGERNDAATSDLRRLLRLDLI